MVAAPSPRPGRGSCDRHRLRAREACARRSGRRPDLFIGGHPRVSGCWRILAVGTQHHDRVRGDLRHGNAGCACGHSSRASRRQSARRTNHAPDGLARGGNTTRLTHVGVGARPDTMGHDDRGDSWAGWRGVALDTTTVAGLPSHDRMDLGRHGGCSGSRPDRQPFMSGSRPRGLRDEDFDQVPRRRAAIAHARRPIVAARWAREPRDDRRPFGPCRHVRQSAVRTSRGHQRTRSDVSCHADSFRNGHAVGRSCP